MLSLGLPPELSAICMRAYRPPIHTNLRLIARTYHTSPSLRQATQAAAAAAEFHDDTIFSRPSHEPHNDPHLTPSPTDYSSNPFTDRCLLHLSTGSGGHGCVSFLREKYIAEGPPNGGDGGTGGSIYIEAVRGETSLHRVARRPILKAGKGGNGKGKGKGGQRGEDVLIQVPVGTVVREMTRSDPVAEEALRRREAQHRADTMGEGEEAETEEEQVAREKFIVFPGPLTGKDLGDAEAGPPQIPRGAQRPAPFQPPSPIQLDLTTPSTRPILLAAGAQGGLGNPHFITRSTPRPKYATRGDQGLKMELHLELKTLADVGLVGLPNAGKSTLLRALTRSRTRVGNWEFTTLNPTIGTVVLDDHKGRPSLNLTMPGGGRRGGAIVEPERRSSFTIADIPGLIQDAHLDKGLGLGFLRHIERAGVLCFVVDLSRTSLRGTSDPAEPKPTSDQIEAPPSTDASADADSNSSTSTSTPTSTSTAETQEEAPAITTLKSLWAEVTAYERLRAASLSSETERRTGTTVPISHSSPTSADEAYNPWAPASATSTTGPRTPGHERGIEVHAPITSKPWFVCATKCDRPSTRSNYQALKAYVERISEGGEQHPSGVPNAWGVGRGVRVVPVSAITGDGKGGVEGVKRVGVELIGGS